jgi:multiple sugar transport system substrate-binding protein
MDNSNPTASAHQPTVSTNGPMPVGTPEDRKPFSRRKFIQAAGASALLPLAARTLHGAKSLRDVNFGSSSNGSIKLWASTFGTGQENTIAAGLSKNWSYNGYGAAYSQIPGDFYEVVESALAANKGPAVADGWAYVGFQYADEGAIYYCDDIVDVYKKNGVYDDYLLDGAYFTALRNKNGQVGIPWGVDTRVFWYNEPLLKKADVAPPTNWTEYLAACKALKKIGVYGFVTSALATNSAYGTHQIAYWMYNNGGGIYNKSGQVDIMSERNVEAMEFLHQLVVDGYVDPGSIGYTDTQVYTELKQGRTAMSLVNATLPQETGTSFTSGPFKVMTPLAGPHGDKGTLQYLKNMQMYKNNPNVEATMQLLMWYNEQYAGKNGFFAKNVTASVPIRKSVIALPQIQSNPAMVKIVNEWVPIAHAEGWLDPHEFSGLAVVDNSPEMIKFAEAMLEPSTNVQSAMKTFAAWAEPYGVSYKA